MNVLKFFSSTAKSDSVLLVIRLCSRISVVWLTLSIVSLGVAEPVSFSREIMPVLSDKCFSCHGPDENHRKAGLRLDVEPEAKGDNDGSIAIVPGDLDRSELVYRITTDDEDDLMPPPDSNKALNDAEKELLQRWIREGAEWGKHWAFEKPVRRMIGDDTNPVDYFVRKRLEREGLEPSSRTELHTLVRRLSFDLTGLAPEPQTVDAIVNGTFSIAGEIDRLLASPHFGERMAMWWLDAARYSDTDGFQQDANRDNWPWRDWVIDSFNANKPFDQFTIEQFAGDLLPEATKEQILATCFHRNHMTNGEGGQHPEESRIEYVLDRVNTTGTVWLGLTLGCAQCHSHKFDPVSQDEYYSLNAFFNSVDEDGRAGKAAKPYMKYRSPYAARAVTEAESYFETQQQLELAARKNATPAFRDWLDDAVVRVSGGFRAWHPVNVREVTSVEGTEFSLERNGTIQATGPNPNQDDYLVASKPGLEKISAIRLEIFPHESHTEGRLSRGEKGEFILTNVKLQLRSTDGAQVEEIILKNAIADFEVDKKDFKNYGKVRETLDDDPRTGWTTGTNQLKQAHTALFELEDPVTVGDDQELVFVMMHRSTLGDSNIGRFRVSVTDQRGDAVRSFEPMPFAELAGLRASEGSEVEGAIRARLFEQFLVDYAPYQDASRRFLRAKRHLNDMKNGAAEVEVMVLAEREEPRDTHVLVRGVWDNKGDVVQPKILKAILDRPEAQTQTRLDLAEWLVARDNPLTARVIVNQLWQLMFGAGLVRTPDDFGLQGEHPTHPELLDWLAVEFVESGWDVKHMVRLMVKSDTYQQSSHVTDELVERDPENRLLARGARFRLPAWMIHDAALASSGLLNPAMGGPPVLPYQPPGLWEDIFKGRFVYDPSPGKARYRRMIYTFWRRASAPAFLFDSSQRLVCETRMRRTNTPLQALTLLNDVNMLEASQHLARLALRQCDGENDRLDFMGRRAIARALTEVERGVLKREGERAMAYYRSHPDDAAALLTVGQSGPDDEFDSVELATQMLLASMIYNLDEAITHE